MSKYILLLIIIIWLYHIFESTFLHSLAEDKPSQPEAPVEPPRLIRCDKCDFRCADQKELTKHSKYHSDKYKYPCEICDVRFTTAQHLQTHMRTHPGEKPWLCTQCGTVFTPASD